MTSSTRTYRLKGMYREQFIYLCMATLRSDDFWLIIRPSYSWAQGGWIHKAINFSNVAWVERSETRGL